MNTPGLETANPRPTESPPDVSTPAVSQGRAVPSELLGQMRDSSTLLGEPSRMRERLAQDGYLYLPSSIDAGEVLAARAEVFGRLAEVGEIEEPPVAGIPTGLSRRREMVDDLGAFWKSVNAGDALRAVTHGGTLRQIASSALGRSAVAFDYMFLRAAPVGRFTGLHFDYGFFTRRTEKVVTAWIALGDIPVDEGPLMVVEGSHRFDDLIAAEQGFDVARDSNRQAALAEHPVDFARARAARLLTSDFEAGDVVIFSMLTMHGTLDNCSLRSRARLSCDVRFQPASDPRDPRYFGANPTGTTGIGWGELNGAKPLNEPWHVR